MTDITSIISAAVGFITAMCVAMWKLFSLYKDHAVLELRLQKLEEKVENNAKLVEIMEVRIMASLTRIEDRLNSLIDDKK